MVTRGNAYTQIRSVSLLSWCQQTGNFWLYRYQLKADGSITNEVFGSNLQIDTANNPVISMVNILTAYLDIARLKWFVSVRYKTL